MMFYINFESLLCSYLQPNLHLDLAVADIRLRVRFHIDIFYIITIIFILIYSNSYWQLYWYWWS